jgi:hypothetical protein
VHDPSAGLPVAVWRDGDAIEVDAHSGWLLLLTRHPILECNGTATGPRSGAALGIRAPRNCF